MDVGFEHFARTQKGCTVPNSVVDVCMDAMQEGTLSVIAKNWYLWEYFTLKRDQWARLCALVQRHRLPPTLLWRLQSGVRWTRHPGCVEIYLVSECPDAIAALS